MDKDKPNVVCAVCGEPVKVNAPHDAKYHALADLYREYWELDERVANLLWQLRGEEA